MAAAAAAVGGKLVGRKGREKHQGWGAAVGRKSVLCERDRDSDGDRDR